MTNPKNSGYVQLSSEQPCEPRQFLFDVNALFDASGELREGAESLLKTLDSFGHTISFYTTLSTMTAEDAAKRLAFETKLHNLGLNFQKGTFGISTPDFLSSIGESSIEASTKPVFVHAAMERENIKQMIDLGYEEYSIKRFYF